jgi:uncharacterized protein (TIGR02246 family)
MVDPNHEADLIRKRIQDCVAAVGRGDVEAVARFYTRDGKFLIPNAPIAIGHDAVAGMWKHLLSFPNVRLKFGPTLIEVAASGELAYDQGTYTLSFDGAKGRIEDRGKYVVVWKREDGEWRVAADIFNSDLPAAAA